MALSRKSKGRLTKLIEFMRSRPKSAEKHFSMGRWFVHDGEHSLHVRYVTREALQDCGTTACALGWAATVPSFRRAGLRVPAISCGPEPIAIAETFFDLDNDRTHALFNPGLMGNEVPKTPKQWARMARSLMKEWSKA